MSVVSFASGGTRQGVTLIDGREDWTRSQRPPYKQSSASHGLVVAHSLPVATRSRCMLRVCACFFQLYIFSEPLSPTQIGEHYAGNFVGAGLAATLSHWQFNEGQGSVAYDSVGTNHLTAGTAVWKLPSAAGKCIATPAVVPCGTGSRTGGFISTRDSNANSVFTSKDGTHIEFRSIDFTVSAWIRRTGSGGQNNWFSVGVSGSSTAGQSLWLAVMSAADSNFLGMGFPGPDTLKATAGPIPNDGAAWFYVSYSVGAVATRGAGANKHARQIFRNGVLVGNDISSTRLSPQTNAFKIGTAVSSGLTGWNGDIDEVRMH